MSNSNIKQAIKPIYHIGAVALLIGVFIVLNLTGLIKEDTPVPSGLDSALQFVLSVRSIYLLPWVFILLVALYAKLRRQMPSSKPIKKLAFWVLAFWVLAFLTGKFYTLGAFLIAWAIAAHYVSYVPLVNNTIPLGIFAIVLGWGMWFLARSLAAWLWRQS